MGPYVMNRCLTFAEGAVTMVCPVLLALALKKINWEGKVKEPVVPRVVLLIAGTTLITGICPLLACCVSKKFESCVGWAPVTTRLAAVSSACLLALACWISLFIVPVEIVMSIGFVFGLCIVAPSLFHTSPKPNLAKKKIRDEENNNVVASASASASDSASDSTSASASASASNSKDKEAAETKAKELHTILDKSHELLSGVTGILFLGLEGLALEGLISTCHGIQDAVRTPMGISFTFCALGVFLMFHVMIQPLKAKTTIGSIALLTIVLDLVMVAGTVAIVATIMNKLMGLKGLLFFSSPFLILLQLAYQLLVPPPTDATDETQGEGKKKKDQEERKAAPMGLTKVTFTGFLAVSVTSISSGSTNEWTDWFLLFAAAAIASGLSWRLLTHIQNKEMVDEEMMEAAKEAANVASFCTHFCIAVATVLFTVMAWEAANKVHVAACARGN